MLYMVLHIKSSKNPLWVLLDVRLEITRCQKGNSEEFLKSNMSVHELRLLNWIKKIVTVYIVCVDILWSAQPIVFLQRNVFMLECVNKRCAFVHRAGAHFLYIQQGTTVPIGLLLLLKCVDRLIFRTSGRTGVWSLPWPWRDISIFRHFRFDISTFLYFDFFCFDISIFRLFRPHLKDGRMNLLPPSEHLSWLKELKNNPTEFRYKSPLHLLTLLGLSDSRRDTRHSV